MVFKKNPLFYLTILAEHFLFVKHQRILDDCGKDVCCQCMCSDVGDAFISALEKSLLTRNHQKAELRQRLLRDLKRRRAEDLLVKLHFIMRWPVTETEAPPRNSLPAWFG